MAETYDKLTFRVVDAPDELVKANPDRYQAVADQKTYMVGPDGQPYTVDAKSAQKFVDSGGQFLHDVAPDAAKQQNLIEYFKEKHDGAVRVGAHEFANQFAFGVPGIIEEHTEHPEELEGRARAESEHKVAQWVGGAAGFASSAYLTGGAGAVGKGATAARVGEQALAHGAEEVLGREAVTRGLAEGANVARAAVESKAPGLLSRMGSAAAQGVKEGALLSSPQAMAQASYGDPEHAAETLLWGIGTGGLLGLGAGAFSEAVNAGRGALRGAAIERGLIDEAGSAKGAVDKIKALAGGTVEDAVASKASAAEKLAAHSESLDSAIAKAGKEAKGLGVLPGELANTVTDRVLETKPGLLTPMYAEQRAELQKLTESIAKNGTEPMSFSKLQDLKSSLAEQASKEGANRDMLRQVENIVHDQQAAAMNQAYNKLGLTKDYGDFLASKAQMQQAMDTMRLGPQMSPLVTGAVEKGAGLLAHGIGGAVGHAVGIGGYAGGKALAPVIEKILQHSIVPKALELSQGVLQKIAKNPEALDWFGGMLAKDAGDALRQKLTGMPLSFATKTAAVALDPVKAMLGPKANGLNKDQQYEKVVSSIANAKADPERMTQEIQTLGQVFHQDPRLQSLLAQKQSAAIEYLHQSIPKDPRPPQPFNPQAKWTPTAAEKTAFLNKLEVAHNPWTVIDRIQAGSLTKEHVEALTALYPSVKDKMIGEVARMAADPSTPHLSAGVKHGLSMLTNINLSPGQVNYQQVYQSGQQQQQQGGQPKSHGSKRPKIEGPDFMTSTQKRDTRR